MSQSAQEGSKSSSKTRSQMKEQNPTAVTFENSLGIQASNVMHIKSERLSLTSLNPASSQQRVSYPSGNPTQKEG